jgi:glutathione S-transferase
MIAPLLEDSRMIKIYGIPLSNYTAMVKVALIEKGIDYEDVVTMPNQESDYLAKSPMGKVPCIETDRGFLTETSAILDYIEELQPEPPLLPSDPYDRAKVRELCQAVELYVELTARKGIGAIFGKEMPEHIKKGMNRDLPRGMTAIAPFCKLSPWIAGDQFTYADIFAYYSLVLASTLAKVNVDMDLLSQIPGLEAWFAKVGERDSVKKIDAEMAKAREAMGR